MAGASNITRRGRAFRSFAIALASTLVAAASHVLAGGNIPSPIALAATVAISLPLTLILASGSAGRTRLFGAVFLSQALFHFIFVYAVFSPQKPASGQIALPAHAEHLNALSGFVPGGAGSANSSGALTLDIAMWLAHAVAALITVSLIRQGDKALISLQTSLSRIFWPRFTGLTTATAIEKVLLLTGAKPLSLPRLVALTDQSRRGPPHLSSF